MLADVTWSRAPSSKIWPKTRTHSTYHTHTHTHTHTHIHVNAHEVVMQSKRGHDLVRARARISVRQLAGQRRACVCEHALGARPPVEPVLCPPCSRCARDRPASSGTFHASSDCRGRPSLYDTAPERHGLASGRAWRRERCRLLLSPCPTLAPLATAPPLSVAAPGFLTAPLERPAAAAHVGWNDTGRVVSPARSRDRGREPH